LGYKLETTALISIDNYNAFRIRCIMLILGKIKIAPYCLFSSLNFRKLSNN